MSPATPKNKETTGGQALPVSPMRATRLLDISSRVSPGALGDRHLLLTINPAGMGYRLMLGLDTVESVAHVIQVALTPVFLLSGIASLLGVLSTRLARVADRVDALAEQLEADGPIDRHKLQRRLAYLRRRSHVLDAAVMMGTLGGVATSTVRRCFCLVGGRFEIGPVCPYSWPLVWRCFSQWAPSLHS